MNEGIPLGVKSTISHKVSVLNKAPRRNFTFTFNRQVFELQVQIVLEFTPLLVTCYKGDEIKGDKMEKERRTHGA
jgi:hypothetical protein